MPFNYFNVILINPTVLKTNKQTQHTLWHNTAVLCSSLLHISAHQDHHQVPLLQTSKNICNINSDSLLTEKLHIAQCTVPMFLFLLLLQALNLLWLEVLALSMTAFHFALSWTQVIQFLIFIWPRSCMMLSSHLCLVLPLGLVVKGFHLNIFLGAPVSGILCTWPNQLSLWALI